MLSTSVWTVLFAALITALATGLGALPFFIFKSISKHWLGIFNSVAAGLMLGASHGLISEGSRLDVGLMLLGLVAGVVVIALLNSRLEADHGAHFHAFQQAGGTKSLLIVGVMTLHSFAEGVGVGVAYGGGDVLGGFITTAIAIHNIPEGLAISLVLVPRGISPGKAGLWSIFSSLPQPLMAVPAFLLVTVFRAFLPFGLGLAAGAMIWMVFAELMPDAIEEIPTGLAASVVTLSLAAMLAFQTLL
jgi:zinc transporter ZupT